MAEPRCGLVHASSMTLLAKRGLGDAAARMSGRALQDEKSKRRFTTAAYEFKLQVAKATAEGLPDVLWIRIGAHPQRCLCVGKGGQVRLEAGQWSSTATETQWRIHFLSAQEKAPEGDAPFPSMFALESVHTGKYLCVREGVPVLGDEADVWGAVPLRGALTPGQVARRGAVAAGVCSVAGSVAAVGAAGAATVSAGTQAAGAVMAVGTAAHEVGKGAVAAKLATAAVSVPVAIVAAIMKLGAAGAAAAHMGAAVHYGAMGVGCGVAVACGGAVAMVCTKLVADARDPGLYVGL